MADKTVVPEKPFGFWIVLLGLLVMLATFGVATWHWAIAAEVTAVLAGMGSVVGSLVGAFFGVQLGATGKKDADQNAAVANQHAATANSRLAWAVAAITDPKLREDVHHRLGDLLR